VQKTTQGTTTAEVEFKIRELLRTAKDRENEAVKIESQPQIPQVKT
jgi:low affinity Fe/Cu permease